MERTWIGLGALFMCMSLVNASPYSKYGRTCKDIGCPSNQVCVMESDPCTYSSRDQCGSYPTCQRSGDSGGLSCTTKVCPSGQYCKTVNGIPTCTVTSSNNEYDSAGVSSVNGHRIDSNTNQNHGITNTNSNPYSNANAPPPEHHDIGTNIQPANNNFGLGYPPDPSNSASYPSYPGVSNNGQRPSQPDTDKYGYPTQNRPPQQSGIYPPYNGGYPLYPTNQQPGYTHNQYPNYPYNNRNSYNSRRPYNNSSNRFLPCITTIGISIIGFILITKYLS